MNRQMPDIEERLLIELCRFRFTDDKMQRIGTVTGMPIDWSRFAHLANEHGIASMVYSNLDRQGLSKMVPEKERNFLYNKLLQSIGRNAFLENRFAGVLKLFNNHGLKTVLLKGMSLENHLYGGIGLRQMSDVDILMTKADCLKANTILAGEGFVPLPLKSVFHKYIFADMGKHLPSMIKDGLSVELHHSLFPFDNSSFTEKLYLSAQPFDIKGQQAYIARPQHEFLFLISHLSSHEMKNESQLRLYADLVCLIEKFGNEIINPNLFDEAEEAGIRDSLATHLFLLEKYWNIDFPDYVDDYIKQYEKGKSNDKFLFYLKSPKNNPVVNKSQLYKYHVASIQGFHRKVLFVLGDIFPTIDFMKRRYHCSALKAVFYYPVRWGKLWYLFGR